MMQALLVPLPWPLAASVSVSDGWPLLDIAHKLDRMLCGPS